MFLNSCQNWFELLCYFHNKCHGNIKYFFLLWFCLREFCACVMKKYIVYMDGNLIRISYCVCLTHICKQTNSENDCFMPNVVEIYVFTVTSH